MPKPATPSRCTPTPTQRRDHLHVDEDAQPARPPRRGPQELQPLLHLAEHGHDQVRGRVEAGHQPRPGQQAGCSHGITQKNKIQSYFDVSREQHSYSMFNRIFLNEGLGDGSSVWKVIDDKDDLKINDVIKLGRFRFKVIDMITTQAPKQD